MDDCVDSGIEQNEVGYITESEDETYNIKCELVDIN